MGSLLQGCKKWKRGVLGGEGAIQTAFFMHKFPFLETTWILLLPTKTVSAVLLVVYSLVIFHWSQHLGRKAGPSLISCVKPGPKRDTCWWWIATLLWWPCFHHHDWSVTSVPTVHQHLISSELASYLHGSVWETDSQEEWEDQGKLFEEVKIGAVTELLLGMSVCG